jgi:hypothetical protein
VREIFVHRYRQQQTSESLSDRSDLEKRGAGYHAASGNFGTAITEGARGLIGANHTDYHTGEIGVRSIRKQRVINDLLGGQFGAGASGT